MAEKARNPEIIEEVAKIVASGADLSVRQIGAVTGESKTKIGQILQKPITIARVRAMLSEDTAAGHTQRSIGSILTALSCATEDILAQGVGGSDEISKLMQLLAALTATAERLARAGIDLGAIRDTNDDTVLRGEIRFAFARGLRAAMAHPGTALAWAARLEQSAAGPPSVAGDRGQE